MLITRLWMGTILVVLTVGMLVVDQWFVPWFPFLFVFVIGLSLAACKELIGLLGNTRTVQVPVLYGGVLLLGTGNWWAHLPGNWSIDADPWHILFGAFIALVLLVFLWEMAHFNGSDSGAIERMSRTIWALAYLGLLPCFLAQLRWLYPAKDPERGSVALALVIFVPKCCDIGAYCVGRLFGRHPMTPVLSPKKTWEGAVGGLICAALAAVLIDDFGPVASPKRGMSVAAGFGILLGIAGMLGDLAESLIKRDCRLKDASAAVPGFGGVLDVVDSVLFAAPVGYWWLAGNH